MSVTARNEQFCKNFQMLITLSDFGGSSLMHLTKFYKPAFECQSHGWPYWTLALVHAKQTWTNKKNQNLVLIWEGIWNSLLWRQYEWPWPRIIDLAYPKFHVLTWKQFQVLQFNSNQGRFKYTNGYIRESCIDIEEAFL